VDYNVHNWVDSLRGQEFDLVFDAVGGTEYYEKLEPLLKKGGVYSSTTSISRLILEVGKDGLMSITNKVQMDEQAIGLCQRCPSSTWR
jgi:NADPH:quinone reductase-like Zn-dependent oxidoreductase